MTQLSRLEHREVDNGQLPGFFYSYLGHAVARCEGRKEDGLAMCLHAVEIEPFQPVNYLNLARTYLLVRDRRMAVQALRRGLAIDPTHRGLRALQSRLGIRRQPPVALLARDSPINRLLGHARTNLRARYKALGRKQSTEAPLESPLTRSVSRNF
ncbi:MAG: hypothetical protein ACE5GX_20590 [Thermoanaerobaculia bacterium]